jgi:hypothetical protein
MDSSPNTTSNLKESACPAGDLEIYFNLTQIIANKNDVRKPASPK